MNVALFVLGVVLLASAVVDLLWTTLWVDVGGGPLSARLMAGVWGLLRRVGNDRSRVLRVAGPLLVVLTFVLWIGLVVAGWTCIFASAENAVVDTQQVASITWVDHLYFVGYTIFTLGIGDIVPTDGVWQVATLLATATGMLFVTMAVSYLVSILGAVARKRAFASSVTAIGSRPEAFVRNAWTGESFEGLDLVLTSVTEEVAYLAYQYNAYPILHYYHTRTDSQASVIGIVILDEAVTLLRYGVEDDYQPNTAILENTAASVDNYLTTGSAAHVAPAEEAPPPPDLDVLREAGIPTVSDEEFAEALEDLADRRRRLLGLVETNAREWPSGEP